MKRLMLFIPMLLVAAPAFARVEMEEVAWENLWPLIYQLIRLPWL